MTVLPPSDGYAINEISQTNINNPPNINNNSNSNYDQDAKQFKYLVALTIPSQYDDPEHDENELEALECAIIDIQTKKILDTKIFTKEDSVKEDEEFNQKNFRDNSNIDCDIIGELLEDEAQQPCYDETANRGTKTAQNILNLVRKVDNYVKEKLMGGTKSENIHDTFVNNQSEGNIIEDDLQLYEIPDFKQQIQQKTLVMIDDTVGQKVSINFGLITDGPYVLRQRIHYEFGRAHMSITTDLESLDETTSSAAKHLPPYFYRYFDAEKCTRSLHNQLTNNSATNANSTILLNPQESYVTGSNNGGAYIPSNYMRKLLAKIDYLLENGWDWKCIEIINAFYEPGFCTVEDANDIMSKDTVIRARGLPWQSSDQDIANFFKGLNISKAGIALCLSPQGRRNGEAFIKFQDAENRELALRRHKHHMGTRYIEIYKASLDDFLKVSTGSNTEVQAFLSTGAEVIIRMRGLPYDASNETIYEFFKNTSATKIGIALTQEDIQSDEPLVPSDILFVRRLDGRATGDAFVLFNTEFEGRKALQKHRSTIGTRYIELFRSTSSEVQQVSNRFAEPVVQPIIPQLSSAAIPNFHYHQHPFQHPPPYHLNNITLQLGPKINNNCNHNQHALDMLNDSNNCLIHGFPTSINSISNQNMPIESCIYNAQQAHHLPLVGVEGGRGSSLGNLQLLHTTSLLASQNTGGVMNVPPPPLMMPIMNADGTTTFTPTTEINCGVLEPPDIQPNIEGPCFTPENGYNSLSTNNIQLQPSQPFFFSMEQANLMQLNNNGQIPNFLISTTNNDGTTTHTTETMFQPFLVQGFDSVNSLSFHPGDSDHDISRVQDCIRPTNLQLTQQALPIQYQQQPSQNISAQTPIVIQQPPEIVNGVANANNINTPVTPIYHLPLISPSIPTTPNFHHGVLGAPPQLNHHQSSTMLGLAPPIPGYNYSSPGRHPSHSVVGIPPPPPLLFNPANLPPPPPAIFPSQAITQGAVKDCIRLRGLPFEARVEQILEFLNEFSKFIVYQGVHMIYNVQGQPSGEAFIQMNTDNSAKMTAAACHNKYMRYGKKQRYIEVFQCSGDEMSCILAGIPYKTPTGKLINGNNNNVPTTLFKDDITIKSNVPGPSNNLIYLTNDLKKNSENHSVILIKGLNGKTKTDIMEYFKDFPQITAGMISDEEQNGDILLSVPTSVNAQTLIAQISSERNILMIERAEKTGALLNNVTSNRRISGCGTQQLKVPIDVALQAITGEDNSPGDSTSLSPIRQISYQVYSTGDDKAAGFLDHTMDNHSSALNGIAY